MMHARQLLLEKSVFWAITEVFKRSQGISERLQYGRVSTLSLRVDAEKKLPLLVLPDHLAGMPCGEGSGAST